VVDRHQLPRPRVVQDERPEHDEDAIPTVGARDDASRRSMRDVISLDVRRSVCATGLSFDPK
jgi:hypothetical protein